MAYATAGTVRRAGLGDIPWPAQGTEAYALRIAIANGSPDALLRVLTAQGTIAGDDGSLAGIAKAYADRVTYAGTGGNGMSQYVRWVLDGKLTLPQYQAIVGSPATDDYNYNMAIRGQFQSMAYDLLNANNPNKFYEAVRFEGQPDWSMTMTGNYNDGSPYQPIANSKDADAPQKILAWWLGYLAYLKAKALVPPPVVLPNTIVDAANIYNVPADSGNGIPSGWRIGTFDGINGYWGPDGLFHSGDAPWQDYTAGSGQSLMQSQAAQAARTAAAAAAARADAQAKADAQAAQDAADARARAIREGQGEAGGPVGVQSVPISIEPPQGYPLGPIQTIPLKPDVITVSSAPYSNMTLYLIGAGVVAYFLYGRKRA